MEVAKNKLVRMADAKKRASFTEGYMKTLSVLFLLLVLGSRSYAKPTAEDVFVARVIFAEALVCSDEERVLVASVIQNRINHPGFGAGKLDTMYDVVCQADAFSCIDDDNNKNWVKSGDTSRMTAKERKVWEHCLKLAQGDFEAVEGVVYYHDFSIKTPKSWNNRYWKAKLRLKTKYFAFYSVEKK